jgi:hypothetical protein
MKIFMIAALFLTTAFAQKITGVSVLKGSLKTKVVVNGISSTCKVKVDKIRNLMEEDAYGFPGYKVKIEARLEGKNKQQEPVVQIDQVFHLTNFWYENGKVVAKDLQYFSTDGALLTIKHDGRLKSLSFPYNNQKITCSF